MADQQLRKARRKTKANLHLLESTFPVPIETVTGKSATNSRWYFYFGHLQTNHVAVSRLGDLTFLYRLGFFGKGILSKSKPQFETYDDVLSEQAKKNFLNRYSKYEPDKRESQLTNYLNFQKERLRQHSLWSCRSDDINKVVKEKPSESTSIRVIQCEDLYTEINCGLHEEITTDGDASTASDSEIGTGALSSKESIVNNISEVQIGSKRSSSSCGEELKYSKHLKLEDSCKLFEYLQLTFEEAFFLSYGLGCLSVQDEIMKTMTLCEMWKTFSLRKTNFLRMYIAYHHFRSKGWVTRLGDAYGADFLLYKDGMPFYHASYCVLVFQVTEGTLVLSDGQPHFGWKEYSTICRINEKVAKEVLLCYIVQPRDLTEDCLTNVNCIKRFKVMELVLRRWLPEKHREEVK